MRIKRAESFLEGLGRRLGMPPSRRLSGVPWSSPSFRCGCDARPHRSVGNQDSVRRADALGGTRPGPPTSVGSSAFSQEFPRRLWRGPRDCPRCGWGGSLCSQWSPGVRIVRMALGPALKRGIRTLLLVTRKDGEDGESTVRRFNKLVQRDGILQEARRRRHFISNREKQRQAERRAARRRRRTGIKPAMV